MELKKFKELRNIGESVFSQTTGNIKVEVVKTIDEYVLYVDGSIAESFRTKEAALEAAEDAVESLGNE